MEKGYRFGRVFVIFTALVWLIEGTGECRRRCGDLAIEYPFGIDDGCGSLEYRSLLVCTNNNTQLELRTPTGTYPVTNITYDDDDPHLIISDPSMWSCSAGEKLPRSQRFSVDISKKFSISNSNNFLYFNCNNSSVLVQPQLSYCETKSKRCESLCDTNNPLCNNLPDCPKALTQATCCSYYPRTSDSLRLMLDNCESYTSIYWDVTNTYGYGYGIRLNYEIPITTQCRKCQDNDDGTCGYHTQFSTFLCLCTHNNATTYCAEHSHVHHLSRGRVVAGTIAGVGIGGMIVAGLIIWYLRKTSPNRALRLGVANNTQ